MKPRIPGYTGIDVMAVDRAGSGDVHGAEIKVDAILPTRNALKAYLKSLNMLPVHFRYLAFNAPDLDVTILRRFSEYDELFDANGIGRVGIIAYNDRLLDPGTPLEAHAVQVVVRPERFLVRGEKLLTLEKYLSKAQPDMDVRM